MFRWINFLLVLIIAALVFAILRQYKGRLPWNENGVMITGIVMDQDDLPIAGATVLCGAYHHMVGNPVTTTDTEGRFSLRVDPYAPGQNGRSLVSHGGPEGPPGDYRDLILTVQAKGYAAELEVIKPPFGLHDIKVRLGPGRTIRGRVEDTDGNPIAGAFVAAAKWRGRESLDWRVRTAEDGSFVWTEAPTGKIRVAVWKGYDYISIRDRWLTASDEEQIFTLPSLKVTGRVLDAQTGDPIPQFQVLPLAIDRNGGGKLNRDTTPVTTGLRVVTLDDGRFEISYGFPHAFHLIRIEAEGYTPSVSRRFTHDEGVLYLEFRLSRSAYKRSPQLMTAPELKR